MPAARSSVEEAGTVAAGEAGRSAESNGTDDWRRGKLWKANRYPDDVSTGTVEPSGGAALRGRLESGDDVGLG